MNDDDEFELNFGDLRRNRNGQNGSSQREYSRWKRSRSRSRTKMIEEGEGAPAGDKPTGGRFPFDPWRLIESLRRGWKKIVLGCVGLALLGAGAGYFIASYSIPVLLIRKEAPDVLATGQGPGSTFAPREVPLETLATLARSPEVVDRVRKRAGVSMPRPELADAVTLEATRNPELVELLLSATGPVEPAVELANAYAEELLAVVQSAQAGEAGALNDLLKTKITQTEADLEQANEELVAFSKEADVLDVDRETERYHSQLASLGTRYYTAQIDLEMVNMKIEGLTDSANSQTPGGERLVEAKRELGQLLIRYTEAHPEVLAKKREIEELQRQSDEGGASGLFSTQNTVATGRLDDLKIEKRALEEQVKQLEQQRELTWNKISGLSESSVRYTMIKGKINALEDLRRILVARQREAELYAHEAFTPYQIFRPAAAEDVSRMSRWLKIGALTVAGGLAGLAMAMLFVLLKEVTDSRIKTADDLARVTKLPVLATLGDLDKMTAEEKDEWAFRALTLIRGKLRANRNQSTVCGFISAHRGEGRSTWVNLLVQAASDRGLRVLTVDTRPNGEAFGEREKQPAPETEPEPEPAMAGAPEGGAKLLPVVTTLQSQVLDYPLMVRDQFNELEGQPVLHIPLPGWIWDLEGRQKWEYALHHWKQIENMFLLVELPPASEPESVLLAENVPQVVWLASSGAATGAETRQHLETLRHAGCHLAGAVLNREPEAPIKKKFNQFTAMSNALLIGFLTLFAAPVIGQETGDRDESESNAQEQIATEVDPVQPPPSAAEETAAPPAHLAVDNARVRAQWQERLTLGPGDVLNFSLYGYPELTKTNLMVNPDGTVSYLQARNVRADGLTVDELRGRLNEELSQYYRVARTMIAPVTYSSKKYFMLGRVNNRGAFILDRPLTLVEAVAQAGGLETGMLENAGQELADLSRSFLIRNGERHEIDFEKLFLNGDLSQNVLMEPGDYLYFPATDLNEVYVLGEVMSPGVASYTPNTTVITAITLRGGFTNRAYRQKLLVVRGSLSQPETFVVDAGDILRAEKPDFKIQRRDIIYVAERPWQQVVELLDEAGQAFVQAAVAGWTGANVGPIIREPFIPEL